MGEKTITQNYNTNAKAIVDSFTFINRKSENFPTKYDAGGEKILVVGSRE